jgi:HAMP domain-containing protein
MATVAEEEPVPVRSVRRLGHVPTFIFSLRWRLSFVLGGVILLCTTAGVLTAVIFLQSTLTDRATSDLQRTLSGASVYLQHEQNRLLNAAELVSTDPAIRGSLDNRLALIERLTPYVNSLNVDILEIVNRRGRVVVNMEATNTSGRLVRNIAGVSQALSGDIWVGLARDPADHVAANGWAMRATAPLQGLSGVVGAVVVGRRLGSGFAGELSRIFDADVNVIVGNRRTGSTQTNQQGVAMVGMLEPPALLTRMASGKITTARVQEQGHTVLSGLVPMNKANGRQSGAVEVVRPLDPLYSIVSRLSLLLLALGILIGIGGAILAMYLLRRVTRRLLSLETVASEIAMHAEGDAPLHNLRHNLPVQGRDEVGSLTRSIDSMMTALDDRMNTIERLYATSQARVNELTGLADVARLLTAARPIDETLATLSQHICRLVGCEAAAIYVPAGERTAAVFGSHGLPEGHAALIGHAIATSAE